MPRPGDDLISTRPPIDSTRATIDSSMPWLFGARGAAGSKPTPSSLTLANALPSLPLLTLAGFLASKLLGQSALLWALPLLAQLGLSLRSGQEAARVFNAVSASPGAFARLRPTLRLIEGAPVEAPGGRAAPEDEAVRHDEARRVRAAIEELPPAARATLVLREYEQLSYREIAAVLEIPIGTVMSRLNYARQLLKERLISSERQGGH